MNNGKVAALDVGERRIGVAIASYIARIAAPHDTIDRSTTDAHEYIKQLIESESVDTLVVGLPRGLDGQETDQTRLIREFARELSDQINIPIVLQDEAVTSAQAEDRLKRRGKPYSKGEIDAEAAAIILEDYLKTAVERTG